MNRYPMPLMAAIAALFIPPAALTAGEIARDSSNGATEADTRAALQALDRWISAEVQRGDPPGLSIAVVHDDEVLLASGYGYANIHNEIEAASSTVYRIASITKLFTSIAVMQMRDAGKLALHDRVTKHLPWFVAEGIDASADDITVERLLTHSSGLRRDIRGVNYLTNTLPTREQFLANPPQGRIALTPGKQWKYSNLGMSLAGEIVAGLSGKSWAEYLETNVLRPLGMDGASPRPSPDTPRLATGYWPMKDDGRYEAAPFVDLDATRPSGNMAASVDDIARFMMFNFRPESFTDPVVLNEETLREMYRARWLSEDWQTGWGLGFWLRRVGETTRIGHGGRLAGFSASMEMDMSRKLGVVVLLNVDAGDPERYVDQAFKWIAATIPADPHAIDPGCEADPLLDEYLGYYGNSRPDPTAETRIENNCLVLIRSHPMAMERVLRLQRIEGDAFRVLVQDRVMHPDTWHGEVIIFRRDDNGRVAGIDHDFGYSPRRDRKGDN